MESAEARGRKQRNVFLPLVSVSDHALTNQQFVNCAYLEILSLCPLPCPVLFGLPVGKLYALASVTVTSSDPKRTSRAASFRSYRPTDLCSGLSNFSILLVAQYTVLEGESYKF